MMASIDLALRFLPYLMGLTVIVYAWRSYRILRHIIRCQEIVNLLSQYDTLHGERERTRWRRSKIMEAYEGRRIERLVLSPWRPVTRIYPDYAFLTPEPDNDERG